MLDFTRSGQNLPHIPLETRQEPILVGAKNTTIRKSRTKFIQVINFNEVKVDRILQGFHALFQRQEIWKSKKIKSKNLSGHF